MCACRCFVVTYSNGTVNIKSLASYECISAETDYEISRKENVSDTDPVTTNSTPSLQYQEHHILAALDDALITVSSLQDNTG
jgi:hypothetical protein